MVSLLSRARAYRVSYQLKLAHLRYGRVVGSYFAPCTRCFAINKLNVILADIYAEVGPAANLLGIEIMAIHQAPFMGSTTTIPSISS